MVAARKEDASSTSSSLSSNGVTRYELKMAVKCLCIDNEWGPGVSTHNTG